MYLLLTYFDNACVGEQEIRNFEVSVDDEQVMLRARDKLELDFFERLSRIHFWTEFCENWHGESTSQYIYIIRHAKTGENRHTNDNVTAS